MTEAEIERAAPAGGFSLEESFFYPQAPLRVFVALHHNIDQWWPDRFRERTRCTLEGQVGGTWTQHWDSGGVLLGTVIVFDPPHLVRVVGQLAMSRPAHNVVDFIVEPLPDGTRLTVQHRCVGDVDDDAEATYRETWQAAFGTALFDFLSRA